MDEFDDIIADDPKSQITKYENRPRTATESGTKNDDKGFSRDVKSRINDVDNVLGLPPRGNTSKGNRQTMVGIYDKNKDDEVDAILSSIAKSKQEAALPPTPPEEDFDDVIDSKRQKRNEIFGLHGANNQPEENPYVDVKILDEEDKKSIDNVTGRVKTPNVYPPISDSDYNQAVIRTFPQPSGSSYPISYPQTAILNPPISSGIGAEDIIPTTKSRRNTKMLKPGGQRKSMAGPSFNALNEGRKETPEHSIVSINRGSSAGIRDDESGITNPLENQDYMGPGRQDAIGISSNAQDREPVGSRHGGLLNPSEGPPPKENLPLFLRDNETDKPMRPPIDLEQASSIYAKRNTVTGQKTNFLSENKRLTSIKPESYYDTSEFENIEITAGMSRHQVEETNRKIDQMITKMKELASDNKRLSAIENDFENEKAKVVIPLEQELKNTKEELAKLKQDYNEEIARAREESSKKATEIHNQYKTTIELLEEEKKQQHDLKANEIEREKKNLGQLHELEVAEMKKMHLKELDRQRSDLVYEIEMLKKQLQKKEELTKITSQVDSLVGNLKGKMEDELRSKNRAINDKEQLLEEKERRLETEKEELELQKKDLEERFKKIEYKEKQLEGEVEEKKKIYQFNKDSFDSQHREALKRLERKQEDYHKEYKDLEIKKIKFEKERQEWEDQYKDQKGSLAFDRVAFEKEKEDFKNFTIESNEYLFR